MAFWGVEVKPGKPFTHSFDSVRGRLRISQATLAIGSSTKKSLVQCNVGDKSPVLLCALLPDKTESCQLDLEFEEADEVIFSVIGPRSVHLTGYYLGNSRNSKLDDESESYGEDIANTDTEERNHSSDDDEYEDSFINDDEDPEALPPSPISSDGVDEVVEIKKPRDRKSVHKRLKKRYQSVESDEETSSKQQNDINGSRAAAIQESESEDDIPISSIFSTKENVKNTIEEKTIFNTKAIAKNTIEEKTNKETVENVDKMAEDDEPKSSKEDPQCNSLPPSEEVGPENKTKQKKKKKEQDKETASDRGSDLQHNSSLPSSEIAHENGLKPKKKRKERSKEEKNHIADSEEVSENSQKSKKRRKERAQEEKSHEDKSPSRIKEDQARQDEANASGNMNKDMNVRNQRDHKPSSESIDIDSAQLACEKKSKKKRKKNRKILENDENVNIEVPLSPKEEKNRSVRESKDENVDIVSSRARTLSNGLVIEDLESGKSDGKIAAPGRKVKVHYIGKLKENGQLIDSNIGKAPFRFRLGDKEIIEGWNLGLDGMQAGDKRRLVIPPTLGYGSQGTGENIPPNSWLVYDIELVSVH